ncbi:hypothetical protein SK3146_02956 [Paenibacillus konkukensis]|uniref:Uncharacterized protein n=1 Tax=Paenibacillus konkukensis TaxID=2020716 RepID=A0ABY4RPX4_9BACL|nr:hypothetical protein SK3146_02956 [Paenibacillus konkukensis]
MTNLTNRQFTYAAGVVLLTFLLIVAYQHIHS